MRGDAEYGRFDASSTPGTKIFPLCPSKRAMAREIDGVMARSIGVAGGLATLAPAVGMWMVLGAVTANVPLPPGVEQFVESVLPVLRGVPGVAEPTLPLELLVPATFFLVAFFLLGSSVILSAVLKSEYTVTVRGGSGGRWGG